MENENKKERLVKKVFNNKNNSVQEWIPIERIFNNGIIKLKNEDYIKIIKIIPINFNLKSQLEKEAILNSYKLFLKTCNFDIQILIQSNKEDLSKHISCVKNSNQNEDKNIQIIANEYINYLNQLNYNKKSSTKNYYLIIKNKKIIEKNKISNLNKKNKNNEINNLEKITNYENIILDELNEKYLKIKDTLSRCGNTIIDINNKKEIKNILFSFFYPKNII